MSKKTRLFVFVLGLALLAAVSGGCKKKNPVRVPPPAGEIKGELQVALATPQGPTKSARETEEIVVIFDHPMAALEPLPLDESTSFLKFEPPFDGIYRWMGTKALAFTPKARFPFATDIKATVPAGTRSMDGYVLKSDFTWSFTTIRPQLVRHEPGNNAEQLKLDTQVLLVFNQPMTDNLARESISLAGQGPDAAEASLPFSLSRPSTEVLNEAAITHPPANVLLLKPAEALKPEFRYTVELQAGLKGREGGLGMEKPSDFSFQTYKKFAFVQIENAEAHDPNDSLILKFTNDVIYKDLISKLRFEPKVEIPDYYAEWDHGNRTVWLDLPFKPETRYTVVVAADLKDEFGNVLGREARAEFTTLPYSPSVRMTTGHGVLESYAELTYPIFAVNQSQVRMQAARISRDGVIPLLRNSKSLETDESYEPAQGFYQIDRPLDFKLPRNVRQFVPLNVKELLGDRFGFLLVQLDTLAEEKWSRYPKAFLQVTELGITGKFSPEVNLVWVTELRTGLPVPEAEIEIRNDTNTVLWAGRTDKDGKALTPGWKLLGLKTRDSWSKPQQWVFARRGGDTALVSSEWGTGIDPYRFKIDYDWSPEPEKVRGTVFTERGIYRAGETVHFKSVIRNNVKGRWTLPSVRTVDCEIKDPFQKSVFKGKAAIDAFGSFALDFETRPDAALGTYDVAVRIPPDAAGDKETQIGDSFRVEAFRAAEFEVHLRSLKESFVFGDPFQAEIRGAYLYGGVMAGQTARWTLRLNASSFIPPGYPGYTFGQELESSSDEEGLSEKSRLIASGTSPLGPDGKFDVKAPLVAEKEHSSVSAALEATIEGPNRRSVSNRIQTYVHQGEYYIGLKPGTSFLKQGEALPVQVISTSPDGTAVPDRKIAVKLIRREWRSARKAGVAGRFKWISEIVDTEVASQDVRTKAEPVETSFKPEKSGFYLLRASGQDVRKNMITTTTDVYVTGKDYVPWQRRDDEALDLVIDRDRYKPGDTARILIKSPYEKAKALVTIERESILFSRVLEIQGSATEIEIPVTSELIPNAFVSVLLVQGRTKASSDATTEDIGKPSFKIGYVALSVDPSEKRLRVDVMPDKKSYKPRESVTLKLKVRDAKNAGAAASLAVAVVDVGVLNLIGYQTPDPYADFYGERPLSVQTSESRLHVVGQRNFSEKGENAGGGGGADAMGLAGLGEVQLRGDFKTTAYWNASVETDAEGEAVVRFDLPDNLTTFRVMAVAQTKESLFGKAATDFKVSKPLLLLPSIPRFARVGDSFQAGAVVSNFSERKGAVKIVIEAKGLMAGTGSAGRDITLGPGESQEVLVSFEADRPGLATLAVRAKMGDDSDGLELAIPVEMPRPTETVATFGEVLQEPKLEKINLPDTIYPEQSRIDVQASGSALTGLGGTVEYLANYPYLCLEQRLSAVLPFIVAPQIIQDFKMSPLDPKDIRKRVLNTIKDIYSHQKESGGFGLWTDSPFESPFVSCYAVFALMKARAAGYDIDPVRLSEGLDFLRNLLKAKPESFYPYDARSRKTIQAFALYLLAYAGRPDPAYAEKFFNERESLSLFGQAYLLKALHLGNGSPAAKEAVRQSLLNKIKITPSQAHFEEDDDASLGWIYSSPNRTTAVILQTLLETRAGLPVLPDIVRWLVEQGRTGRWRSTQENFYVFYALNEFYGIAEKVKPDFKAEITIAGKPLLQDVFRSVTQAARASAALSEFKTAKDIPLQFTKIGNGTFYYGARLTYAPKSVLAPRDEGFAVYKTITTLDGRPADMIKAGTLVLVTLQVVVPKESLFVVVDDPLPAGFEAVNGTFLTESGEQQRRLDALHEKDNKPWWQGFDHTEIRDNKILLFADSLLPGIHTHRYLARALTFGRFTLPGTKAEGMYEPEVFGRSVERSVKIVK